MSLYPQTIKNRFHILDLLRLVAAFGVVFYHYSIYLPKTTNSFILSLCDFGYLGVNFFFMLSGFVIMASAEGRGAFAFAFARAQRLYPAFVACLLITATISWFATGAAIPLKQILWNATILNDYIKVPNVDGVYWTLQAEIKFYGCIFLLSFLGVLHQWRYWLGGWAAVATIFHFYQQPFFMGWFINPEYSFYFIAGACAYLMYKNPDDKWVKILFWFSCVFAILKSENQIHDFITALPEAHTIVAQLFVAGFFLFFYFLAQGWLNIKIVPGWWPYMGAVSYPLYLLHNRMGKAIIEYYSGYVNINVLLLMVIIFLICSCLLVHFLVEKPISKVFKLLGAAALTNNSSKP